MNQILIVLLLSLLCLSLSAFSQVPVGVEIHILKAEDARSFDRKLEDLLKHPHYDVRTRAALAVGRIGDERAIPALLPLLEKGTPMEREMAAFALGEIESIKGADAVLKGLEAETRAVASVPRNESVVRGTLATARVSACLVEAAGKIAAANINDPRVAELRTAILDTLRTQDIRGNKQSREVVLLALTAALRVAPRDANRARPDDTDTVVAKFLTNPDARIRADAANTLSRVRAKNANETLRKILATDADPIVRANAARALGAAEDAGAFDILLTAVNDQDSRVRVSAIRSLATLKNSAAVDKLLKHGSFLLDAFTKSKRYRFNPKEKSELLEIAVAVGRLVPNTNHQAGIEFLKEFRKADFYHSPEIEIAFARISPKEFLNSTGVNATIGSNTSKKSFADWRLASSLRQGEGEIASLTAGDANFHVRRDAERSLSGFLFDPIGLYRGAEPASIYNAIPDVLRAYAGFKPGELQATLFRYFAHRDVIVRATAAELLGELSASTQNTDALKVAFAKSIRTDKHDNDAQLAILSALVKLDKNQATDSLKLALDATDYLVRRHAATLIRQNELAKEFADFESKVGPVRKYDPKTGTKLGQVLNTDADYRRAAARKNGTVKAILTTEKGTFTIDLLAEDAPLTVDNFIKLAKSNYFNGLEVHRVVPNFVMQDGDPRGDGNGGPGWSIRCEINTVPYERGVVGMALSGKDTGGSQWFVTHSPQPHLDGGYTVFGRVNETGMKIVDNIVRGDKILSVRIVESSSPQRTQRERRK